MGELIALPTAAPKKVRQPTNGAAREAKNALPQFPVEKVFRASPFMQRCKEQAREMLNTEPSAVMQMALAVFAVMRADDQARIQGRLLALKLRNQRGASGALAWLEYEQGNQLHKLHVNEAAALLAYEELEAGR